MFLSIIGVKGFRLVKEMADILTKDELAVSITGKWGGRKDFVSSRNNRSLRSQKHVP
jgi:hypothetical protein